MKNISVKNAKTFDKKSDTCHSVHCGGDDECHSGGRRVEDGEGHRHGQRQGQRNLCGIVCTQPRRSLVRIAEGVTHDIVSGEHNEEVCANGQCQQ